MRKSRIFSFAASLCVLVMALAMFSCSSSDSVTGSTDIDSLVENNPGGLNFILEFDGEMDTNFPPGTTVVASSESFVSPPVAQAFAPFMGCFYFPTLPPTTQLIAAYWISTNRLLILMGAVRYGTVNATVNRSTCSDAYKLTREDGNKIPEQNISIGNDGTVAHVGIRVGF